MLAAGVILWFALRLSVTSPLEKMTAEIRSRQEKGFLADPLEENRKDEIGELSRAFNALTARLKTTHENTRDAKSFLRAVLSNTGEGIVVLNRDMRIKDGKQPRAGNDEDGRGRAYRQALL